MIATSWCETVHVPASLGLMSTSSRCTIPGMHTRWHETKRYFNLKWNRPKTKTVGTRAAARRIHQNGLYVPVLGQLGIDLSCNEECRAILSTPLKYFYAPTSKKSQHSVFKRQSGWKKLWQQIVQSAFITPTQGTCTRSLAPMSCMRDCSSAWRSRARSKAKTMCPAPRSRDVVPVAVAKCPDELHEGEEHWLRQIRHARMDPVATIRPVARLHATFCSRAPHMHPITLMAAAHQPGPAASTY